MSEESCWSAGSDGISLKVKAKTGAPRDAVGAVKAGELVVEVRAAPEKGKANAAIVKVLAEALGVRRDEVSLRRGAAAHHKVFALPPSAAGALQALCGAGNPSSRQDSPRGQNPQRAKDRKES
jgi:uncharacterized protein